MLTHYTHCTVHNHLFFPKHWSGTVRVCQLLGWCNSHTLEWHVLLCWHCLLQSMWDLAGTNLPWQHIPTLWLCWNHTVHSKHLFHEATETTPTDILQYQYALHTQVCGMWYIYIHIRTHITWIKNIMYITSCKAHYCTYIYILCTVYVCRQAAYVYK